MPGALLGTEDTLVRKTDRRCVLMETQTINK